MSIKLTGDALAPFRQLLKQYDSFIQNKDVSGIMSLFVEDDEPVSFGLHVNLDDRESLQKRFTEYFNSTEPFVAEYDDPIVYQFGEAACLCIMLRADGAVAPLIRTTVFLENHAGKWLIRHQHLSKSPA
ncbi:MAG: YybH family protein [Endozoicomonas sp.]